MNYKDFKHLGRAAWQVMAEVLGRHGDGEGFSRFIQGAFSGQAVRSWLRQPESEDYRENGTGRIGPLERIDNVIDYVRLRDNGSPVAAQPIAHHVAERCGGVFFPLPAVAKCDNSEALHLVGKVLQEAGEVVEDFRLGWLENTPGHISKKEYMEIAKEVDEAAAVLIQLKVWAEGKVAE